jgi:uncharacterized protein (UPF0264 family)
MEATKMEPSAAAVAATLTPTVDQIVEEYVADQEGERTARVNVFADCVKGGQVTVTTEAQASEIARMINRAEREIEDVQAIADAMVARAQSRLKNLEFLFMTPLAIWTSARLAGKKVRNIILEGGQLSLRKVPASIKTVDPANLLEWAQKELPDAVEMVPKVKTDVVKAWEKESDKIAPGRMETPESESFKVSVPKEK